MNAVFKVLAVALCCSAASGAPADTTISGAAAKGAEFVSVPVFTGFEVGMRFKLDDGHHSETKKITKIEVGVLGTQVEFDGLLEHGYAAGTALSYYVLPVTTTPEVVVPVPPTTANPSWDSSASLGSSASGSSKSLDSSSGSLESSNSDSFHDPKSSGSDSSGSMSSGSKASGSSGSFLELWLWLILLAMVCLICVAVQAGAKPKKKKAKKSKAKAPEPVAEEIVELPELQPLMVPQLLPMTSGMYAAPMTTSYAMPAQQYTTTSQYAPQYAPQYAAAPAVYAQPGGIV